MYIAIEKDNDVIDIEICYIMATENDSIGQYEFWGSTFYDKRDDYYVLEGFDWNKNKYDAQTNALIEKYISENYEELSKEALAEWELNNN